MIRAVARRDFLKTASAAAAWTYAASRGADAAVQQSSNPGAEPPIARPAYPPEAGPVVAIDEAHRNTHSIGGAFKGLGRLLTRDGFRVRPLADAISREALEGIGVLVIAQPGGWDGADASLDDGEAATLLEWVRRGGSLLLILDHRPGPAGGQRMTSALGIESWHDGYAAVDTPDGPVYTIRYQRSGRQPEAEVFPTLGGGTAWQGPDALVLDHLITAGRGAAERVDSVMTFGGSAFRPPPGAEPLLVLPARAISLAPTAPDGNPRVPGTPRVPVGGWLGGAVLRVDRGRVALFAETGMFSAQWPVHEAASQNYKLVVNVMRWLSGALAK